MTATIRSRLLLAVALGVAAFAFAPMATEAQQKTPSKKSETVKAGPGEKVCRVKLQYTGEVRTWVCPKEVPCCVWHEINYVKCGTTFTGCL